MNSTQHRLVSRYLDDLTRALADLDPADRAEVLAGVREHIEAGLAARGGTSDADVSAVLFEVGTPEDVAREAYSTGQYAERPAQQPAAPPAKLRWSDRPWVPVAVAIMQAFGVLFIVGMVGVGAAVITSVQVQGSDGLAQYEVSYAPPVEAVLIVGVMLLPLWIAIALLVGNSSLWTSREKVLHLLLMPVGLPLHVLLPTLGWAIAGEPGVYAGGISAMVLTLVGGIWLTIRLTVAARRRSAARAQQVTSSVVSPARRP